MDTPSICPPLISQSAAWISSTNATPSMCKSRHFAEVVPKSLVVPEGARSELTLPVNVIVSLVALPRDVFPLTVKFAETVTLFGNPIWIWLFWTIVSISFVVPTKLRVSVPTETVSVPPKSAPIVRVVSILSNCDLTAFADTRVSWFDDTDDKSVSMLV